MIGGEAAAFDSNGKLAPVNLATPSRQGLISTPAISPGSSESFGRTLRVRTCATLVAYAATKQWAATPEDARKARSEHIVWLAEKPACGAPLGQPAREHKLRWSVRRSRRMRARGSAMVEPAGCEAVQLLGPPAPPSNRETRTSAARREHSWRCPRPAPWRGNKLRARPPPFPFSRAVGPAPRKSSTQTKGAGRSLRASIASRSSDSCVCGSPSASAIAARILWATAHT